MNVGELVRQLQTLRGLEGVIDNLIEYLRLFPLQGEGTVSIEDCMIPKEVDPEVIQLARDHLRDWLTSVKETADNIERKEG